MLLIKLTTSGDTFINVAAVCQTVERLYSITTPTESILIIINPLT